MLHLSHIQQRKVVFQSLALDSRETETCFNVHSGLQNGIILFIEKSVTTPLCYGTNSGHNPPTVPVWFPPSKCWVCTPYVPIMTDSHHPCAEFPGLYTCYVHYEGFPPSLC